MANEAVYKYGTQKTLEANGSSVSANAFSQANDNSMTASDHNDYTMLDFVLVCAFASAVTTNEKVRLYARPLDVEGTNDSPAPSTTYASVLLGEFLMDSAAGTNSQYVTLTNVNLPARTFDCYIENKCTPSLNAGWILRVTPKTIGPY